MLELQGRGVQVALLCSDAFVPLAHSLQKLSGANRLPLIIIQHPLGGIERAAVRARADQALPQLITLLQTRQHA